MEGEPCEKKENWEERAKKAEERTKKAEDELAETKEKLKKAEAMVASLKANAVSTEEDDTSEDENSVTDDNDPWNIKFRQLREYRIINGHCRVPQKGSNPQLGNWLLRQKKGYGNVDGKKISQERINKLDGLGIVWGKAYPAPVSWEKRFEELQKYQKAMGSCNVHVSSTDPSSLAKWVSTQRSEFKRFKKGRDSLLTMEQIEQLKAIGFNWKGPRLA